MNFFLLLIPFLGFAGFNAIIELKKRKRKLFLKSEGFIEQPDGSFIIENAEIINNDDVIRVKKIRIPMVLNDFFFENNQIDIQLSDVSLIQSEDRKLSENVIFSIIYRWVLSKLLPKVKISIDSLKIQSNGEEKTMSNLSFTPIFNETLNPVFILKDIRTLKSLYQSEVNHYDLFKPRNLCLSEYKHSSFNFCLRNDKILKLSSIFHYKSLFASKRIDHQKLLSQSNIEHRSFHSNDLKSGLAMSSISNDFNQISNVCDNFVIDQQEAIYHNEPESTNLSEFRNVSLSNIEHRSVHSNDVKSGLAMSSISNDFNQISNVCDNFVIDEHNPIYLESKISPSNENQEHLERRNVSLSNIEHRSVHSNDLKSSLAMSSISNDFNQISKESKSFEIIKHNPIYLESKISPSNENQEHLEFRNVSLSNIEHRSVHSNDLKSSLTMSYISNDFNQISNICDNFVIDEQNPIYLESKISPSNENQYHLEFRNVSLSNIEHRSVHSNDLKSSLTMSSISNDFNQISNICDNFVIDQQEAIYHNEPESTNLSEFRNVSLSNIEHRSIHSNLYQSQISSKCINEFSNCFSDQNILLRKDSPKSSKVALIISLSGFYEHTNDFKFNTNSEYIQSSISGSRHYDQMNIDEGEYSTKVLNDVLYSSIEMETNIIIMEEKYSFLKKSNLQTQNILMNKISSYINEVSQIQMEMDILKIRNEMLNTQLLIKNSIIKSIYSSSIKPMTLYCSAPIVYEQKSFISQKNRIVFPIFTSIPNYKKHSLLEMSKSISFRRIYSLSMASTGHYPIFSQPPFRKRCILRFGEPLSHSLVQSNSKQFDFDFRHFKVSPMKYPPLLHFHENEIIADFRLNKLLPKRSDVETQHFYGKISRGVFLRICNLIQIDSITSDLSRYTTPELRTLAQSHPLIVSSNHSVYSALSLSSSRWYSHQFNEISQKENEMLIQMLKSRINELNTEMNERIIRESDLVKELGIVRKNYQELLFN